jgi:hypothetical protein
MVFVQVDPDAEALGVVAAREPSRGGPDSHLPSFLYGPVRTL